MTLLLLLACDREPQPCDDLCEAAGFSGVEEYDDGCYCSGGDGLGGSLDQAACEDYCVAVGGSADDAEVTSTQGTDDTCLCVSEDA